MALPAGCPANGGLWDAEPVFDRSAPTGPRRLDEHQAKKITAETTRRYQRSAAAFVAWLDEHGLRPHGAAEWDDLLVEYKVEHPELSRASFLGTLAAVEWFFPHFRHQLHWSHAVVQGWFQSGETRHTVPLCFRQTALLATFLSSEGLPRLGVALMTQVRLGLRPSELLALERQDIVLPSSWGGPAGQQNFVIGLGRRTGTKVKRAQYSLLRPTDEPTASLFGRVVLATDSGHLFPYTQPFVARWLKLLEERLHISVGWTPHSARAGFATDRISEGWSFTQVKEAGRWISDSSLRTYVDVIQASRIDLDWKVSGLEQLQELALAKLGDYFPDGVFNASSRVEARRGRSVPPARGVEAPARAASPSRVPSVGASSRGGRGGAVRARGRGRLGSGRGSGM